MRVWGLAAVLAIGPAFAWPLEHAQRPPQGLEAYFDAIQRADAIEDPEKRCLAYPDLPGSTWGAGAGQARCALLRFPKWTFGDVRTRVESPERIQQLDAHFAGLMEAHYREPDKREQVFIQYQVFDEKPEALQVAAAWVKAVPDSPYARTAMALALVAQGSAARGTRVMADTSDDALQAMRSKFESATNLLAPVVRSHPRLLPACHALAGIYRNTHAPEAADAIDTCLKADPASYFVMQEWMAEAEPRWGGSEALMVARSRHIARYAPRNPMLYALSVNHLDANRLRAGDKQRVLRELGPLVRQAPNARLLRMVGDAHLSLGQNWEAFVVLSQALRFAPEYKQETVNRAKALQQLGYPQWAEQEKDRWARESVSRRAY